MKWFACDTELLHDDRIAELAGAYGPGAITIWLALLAAAKSRGKGGTVHIVYRHISAQAFVDDVKRTEEVIETMKGLGLLSAENLTVVGCDVTLTSWQRYQRDALHQQRQAKYRDRKKADGPPTTTQRHASVTKASPTRTRTGTGTRTAKDETVAKDGQDASLVQASPLLQSVVGRFRAAEAERNGKGLNVSVKALANALDDYSHVPDLERRCFDCAHWLTTKDGMARKDAAKTLRTWLRKEAPKEAKREKRYTNIINR